MFDLNTQPTPPLPLLGRCNIVSCHHVLVMFFFAAGTVADSGEDWPIVLPSALTERSVSTSAYVAFAFALVSDEPPPVLWTEI